jgi:hypothetical protein
MTCATVKNVLVMASVTIYNVSSVLEPAQQLWRHTNFMINENDIDRAVGKLENRIEEQFYEINRKLDALLRKFNLEIADCYDCTSGRVKVDDHPWYTDCKTCSGSSIVVREI